MNFAVNMLFKGSFIDKKWYEMPFIEDLVDPIEKKQ